VNEIEDTVPAGILPGNEIRPRHRRLRRGRGAEDLKIAFGHQPSEGGQHTFVHEPLQQERVHPVQAEADDLPVSSHTGRGQGPERGQTFIEEKHGTGGQ